MEEKEVQCSFCGYTMKLDARKQGLPSVECPACGKLIMNAEELREADRERGFNLSYHAGAARPKKDCPHCGGAVDPESVICPQCGYNWLIGKTHMQQQASTSALIKWTAIGAMAAVVVILAALFLKNWNNGHEQVAMAPAADVSSDDNAATPLPKDGGPIAQEQEDAGEESAHPIAIPDRPGFSDKDRERLRVYRDTLLAQLDAQYPAYTKEEQVRLRQGNGRIRRGEYLGIKSNLLVIVEGNGTAEIPLELLDRDTRLHCDEAFRQQYVRSRLRRAAQQLQREKMSNPENVEQEY
ncbi:MAG: hypothetical protein EOM20_05170 [Spartobacteria bacterium]|nr:hypothetical protein [Spartobacteria bacterium]